jgi:hypothetical protein
MAERAPERETELNQTPESNTDPLIEPIAEPEHVPDVNPEPEAEPIAPTDTPLRVAEPDHVPEPENAQPPRDDNEWEVLRVADNYEINRNTLAIRHRVTGIAPTISICRHTGYFHFTINSTSYKLHRVVALQFVPNPDPARFPFVDHIDRNKTNNNINNLRWVTHAFNNRNLKSNTRHTFEWVDALADGFLQVPAYGNYNFNELFYSQGNFYVKIGEQFRRLEVKRHRTTPVVYARDIQGRKIQIYLGKIMRDYNLH